MAHKMDYLGIGGSDAHLTSSIATCLTRFEAGIESEQDLVDALLSGRFSPVRLEDTCPDGIVGSEQGGNPLTLEVEFDRSLLGKEHLSGPFTVSEELIRDFCDAVGETDPIHTDEAAARQAGFSSIVAPPTFVHYLRPGHDYPGHQAELWHQKDSCRPDGGAPGSHRRRRRTAGLILSRGRLSRRPAEPAPWCS